MLNRFENEPEIATRIEELLHELYEGITGFHVQVFGGKMQVKLTEGKFSIPASRLSDGTLRFLSLLAILLNPTPPPLICLEEPELGLHPDAVLAIGRLIRETSERTQIIVTTHSDILGVIDNDRPMKIFVEGGGNQRALLGECRKAFRDLFEKAGVKKGSFEIVASGSRLDAYKDFKNALNAGYTDAV
nr:hypothetical protein [Tanacetum cinerariifolium]